MEMNLFHIWLYSTINSSYTNIPSPVHYPLYWLYSIPNCITLRDHKGNCSKEKQWRSNFVNTSTNVWRKQFMCTVDFSLILQNVSSWLVYMFFEVEQFKVRMLRSSLPLHIVLVYCTWKTTLLGAGLDRVHHLTTYLKDHPLAQFNVVDVDL